MTPVWFVLGLLCGVATFGLVHEGGHWLVARVQGHGVRELRLWTLRPYVETVRAPGRVFFLAGPLANLLAAASLWAVLPAAVGLGAALPHLLLGLANLLPVGDNDGRGALFGPRTG